MPVTAPSVALPDSFVARLQSGAPIGLAVSGGSDSIALLHLAVAAGGNIAVATVDHGLRAGARAECDFVATICAQYGLSHQVLHWQGWDQRGNLQDQARKARYDLLAQWAKARGLAEIALGHTADDQAETLLMALARGAGVDGLAGMPEFAHHRGLGWHRPLLQINRADLRADLAARGLAWMDDPSNADPRFERVRMRQAQPLLAALGLTPQALGQVARHMASAAATLAAQSRADLDAFVVPQSGDMLITVPLAGLGAEPARRLVLAAMAQVNRALTPPRHAEQRHMLQIIAKGGQTTLGGCVVRQDGAVLRISREYGAVAGLACATDQIWDRRWRLTGPHDPALQIKALGDGIALCPDWRDQPLPRSAVQASPAIWRDQVLVCAPLAGFGTGWTAQIVAENG
jgi:tRNA(Ile)-lysidine synthase